MKDLEIQIVIQLDFHLNFFSGGIIYRDAMCLNQKKITSYAPEEQVMGGKAIGSGSTDSLRIEYQNSPNSGLIKVIDPEPLN